MAVGQDPTGGDVDRLMSEAGARAVGEINAALGGTLPSAAGDPGRPMAQTAKDGGAKGGDGAEQPDPTKEKTGGGYAERTGNGDPNKGPGSKPGDGGGKSGNGGGKSGR